MRTMEIPLFPDRVEIPDSASFTNERLAGEFRLSKQASALARYMFCPASEVARASFGSALRSVAEPLRLNLKVGSMPSRTRPRRERSAYCCITKVMLRWPRSRRTVS